MSLRHRKHVTHITHNDLHISCNSSTFQAQPHLKNQRCLYKLSGLPTSDFKESQKKTRKTYGHEILQPLSNPSYFPWDLIYTSPERWPENSLFGTHKKPPAGTQGTWRSPRACQPRKPRKANCSKNLPVATTNSQQEKKKLKNPWGFHIWNLTGQLPRGIFFRFFQGAMSFFLFQGGN